MSGPTIRSERVVAPEAPKPALIRMSLPVSGRIYVGKPAPAVSDERTHHECDRENGPYRVEGRM